MIVETSAGLFDDEAIKSLDASIDRAEQEEEKEAEAYEAWAEEHPDEAREIADEEYRAEYGGT